MASFAEGESVRSVTVLEGAHVVELIFLDWSADQPGTTAVVKRAVKRLD